MHYKTQVMCWLVINCQPIYENRYLSSSTYRGNCQWTCRIHSLVNLWSGLGLSPNSPSATWKEIYGFWSQCYRCRRIPFGITNEVALFQHDNITVAVRNQEIHDRNVKRCKSTKIKKNKILEWRIELAAFSYSIKYQSGKDNIIFDTQKHFVLHWIDQYLAICNKVYTTLELHECFIASKNQPFSTEEVKKVCSSRGTCVEPKPKFFHKEKGNLIKTCQQLDRLMSIDSKPPQISNYIYIFTIVYEYSRFPFAFPCVNMHTLTVVKYFDQLFTITGHSGAYTLWKRYLLFYHKKWRLTN